MTVHVHTSIREDGMYNSQHETIASLRYVFPLVRKLSHFGDGSFRVNSTNGSEFDEICTRCWPKHPDETMQNFGMI